MVGRNLGNESTENRLGPSVLRVSHAEPFPMKLLISAVLLDFEQRLVHRFPIRAIGRKENTVILFAENCADDLNLSFALVRCIVEQDRSVVDDGIRLTLLNGRES